MGNCKNKLGLFVQKKQTINRNSYKRPFKDKYTLEVFKFCVAGMFLKYNNNVRKQMQGLVRVGWDYLCIHILFFEYERAYFIWVHIENGFQQRRL